jgi:hypothetical protein
MEMNIQDLYKLFEDNQLSFNPVNVQQQQTTNNTSFIKKGDIVVIQFKDREFRGEVNKIYEKSGLDAYDIKIGNTIISVNFDNILEHYPKNRNFEHANIKEVKAEEITQKKVLPTTVKPIQKPSIKENKTDVKPLTKTEPTKKVIKKEDEVVPKKSIQNPKEIEEIENNKNPENTNFTNETIRLIGKIVYFSEKLKLDDVINILAKKGIDKEKCWYFITEKNNNEIHIIRNNDKGYQIQPFVISFIDLKIKNQINEAVNQIKIKGNNNFSIISDIPNNLYEQIKNGLIALLSQIKK